MKKYLNKKNGVITFWYQDSEFPTVEKATHLEPIPDSIQFHKVIGTEFQNVRPIIRKESYIIEEEVKDEEGNVIISAVWDFRDVEVIETFTDVSYSVIEDEAAVKAFKETELYNAMKADIATEMTKVFSTVNKETASFRFQLWTRMLAKPEMHLVSSGLSTIQEVVDYSTAKINEADLYSVYVVSRENQFRADKALL
jgi:hypothetical protein